ncbi:MAG: polysaccharide deacetylase family protein [Deltaproteobacteria bacterium]|nr:polysaccharide deacetylase family protein [Deltaproteobacteria bacterium]MBW2419157.1 polysaccharide deacetylase family protein [Deltaproteobacteria bacterium]
MADPRSYARSRQRLLLAALVGLVTALPVGCRAVRDAWLGDLGIIGDPHPAVLYSVDISVDVEHLMLALTIDDGPDAETTPIILDVLERNDARATFFVLSDRIEGNEALVRRMIEEGHELGNHMARDFPSVELPPQEFEAELLEAEGVLSLFDETRWFRPGSGWYNEEMLSTLSEQGYDLALGSIYPLDAHIPSTAFARNLLLWRAQPGAIIVLHDVGKRGLRTADTLSRVLPELTRRGYRVVTLSELVDGRAMALGAENRNSPKPQR